MKPARNVCLVLADPDASVVRERFAHPARGVDLFELRIDCLSDRDRRPEIVRDLVGASPFPVIATCRHGDQGGRVHDVDDRRRELLAAALDAGAALVDLEWGWFSNDPSLAAAFPRDRLQLSHHHAGPFSSSIQEVFVAMVRAKAFALKLVARADTFEEASRLVQLTALGVKYGRRTSCFATGPAARVSRILSCVEGSFLTYVTTDADPPAAGMLSLDEAAGLYRLGDLPDPVKLLGILGHPLDHSLSPLMHNRVIRRLGERYLYVPFEASDPAPVVDFVRSRKAVRGLSVTIPHKIAVIPLLDALDGSARDAGAVNTIVRDGERLVGHNTDLAAARAIFARWGIGPSDRALVLGAGGGARAISRALTERGVPTTLVSRNPDRARDLAKEFGASVENGTSRAPDYNVLVNATPLGTAGEDIGRPVPAGGTSAVLDLAYRPGGTPLGNAARRNGCRVVDGLRFLADQGAIQYGLWTRRIVSPSLFHEALADLGEESSPGPASPDSEAAPGHPAE